MYNPPPAAYTNTTYDYEYQYERIYFRKCSVENCFIEPYV